MLYADDCEDDPAELRCPPIACLLFVKPTRDFGSRLHSRMKSYTNCWMAGSTGTFGSILSELERGHSGRMTAHRSRPGVKRLDMLASHLSDFAPEAVFGSAVLALTARWKRGIICPLHE
jgi:hypothetical protein